MPQSSDPTPLGPLAPSVLDLALALPISDRVELIERILRTITADDTNNEWLKEAEVRLAAYREGELAAVDADQAFGIGIATVEELRAGFSEYDWAAWDAQIEADSKSGKLDKLIIEAWQERRRELVDGEVQGIPGPLVFGRLRAKLPLTAEERTELNRCVDAYERSGNLSRPAEEVIADIRQRLSQQSGK